MQKPGPPMLSSRHAEWYAAGNKYVCVENCVCTCVHIDISLWTETTLYKTVPQEIFTKDT
uniref:Uncharacterized protein n=1 Tax=Dicentrarchus labrax TaxID=13489 RepID=A0A8C4NML6_DICLA